MKRIKWHMFLYCLLLNLSVFGQEECENPLPEAVKLFEKGLFNDCIMLLEGCIDRGHSDEEKFEAYHLLAQCYLNLNETERADEYTKMFLTYKPNYQQFPNLDPPEFSKVIAGYTVRPLWIAGMFIGLNSSSIKLKQSRSIYNSPQRYYRSAGYQFGVESNYSPAKQFSLDGAIQFSGYGIIHEVDNAVGWKQTYLEDQKFIGFKTGYSHYFTVNPRIQTSLDGGFWWNIMYDANVLLESVESSSGLINQSTQNALGFRNRFQPAFYAGAGMSMQLSKGTVGIGSSCVLFFRQTVNTEKNFDNLDFVFDNQYINDDIKLRTFTINISYKMPLKWRIDSASKE